MCNSVWSLLDKYKHPDYDGDDDDDEALDTA